MSAKKTEVTYEPPARIKHIKKRAFLIAFSRSGKVRRSCQAAGIVHFTYYDWLKKDADFAEEANEAREHFIEWLEARCDEIATQSKNPSVVGMIFRLKALRPEVYRERHEIKLSEKEVDNEIEKLLASRGGFGVKIYDNSNGHDGSNGHS